MRDVALKMVVGCGFGMRDAGILSKHCSGMRDVGQYLDGMRDVGQNLEGMWDARPLCPPSV